MQKQINCTPAREILDTYLRIYKYESKIELDDDLILVITINLCFKNLEIIFNDQSVDLSSIKNHIQENLVLNNIFERKSTESMNLDLNCDKYLNIIKICKSSPIFPNQISGGILFFLYNLLQSIDSDALLSRYKISKQIWLDILKSSTHMVIETHRYPANTLSIQDFEYINIQLESPNVMSRLFAIFSLIGMSEYAEHIKKSIKVVIDDELSRDMLDWSCVPQNIKKSIISFLQNTVEI